jgi:hypothetical protein
MPDIFVRHPTMCPPSLPGATTAALLASTKLSFSPRQAKAESKSPRVVVTRVAQSGVAWQAPAGGYVCQDNHVAIIVWACRPPCPAQAEPKATLTLLPMPILHSFVFHPTQIMMIMHSRVLFLFSTPHARGAREWLSPNPHRLACVCTSIHTSLFLVFCGVGRCVRNQLWCVHCADCGHLPSVRCATNPTRWLVHGGHADPMLAAMGLCGGLHLCANMCVHSMAVYSRFRMARLWEGL